MDSLSVVAAEEYVIIACSSEKALDGGAEVSLILVAVAVGLGVVCACGYIAGSRAGNCRREHKSRDSFA